MKILQVRKVDIKGTLKFISELSFEFRVQSQVLVWRQVCGTLCNLTWRTWCFSSPSVNWFHLHARVNEGSLHYYHYPGNQSSVYQFTLCFFKDVCYRLKPYFFSIEHTVSKIYALKPRQKCRNNRWLGKQIQGLKDQITNK